MNKVHTILDRYIDIAALYAPKIVLALVVFVLGLWVTNLIARFAANLMMKKKVDESLQSFLSSLISVSLKILLLITIAGILGLQTTSFVAIIGAVGLAVGLALQGSLSNFAGGVLILVFKPIKVGDLIESGGQFGEVKEIQIFNTILLTSENKTVILANSTVSNGTIINHSHHGNIRVDITLAIATDIEVTKARAVALNILSDHPKVLKKPAPTVNILSIAGGAVTLAIRPYTNPTDYWDVYFECLEQLKKAFEENKLSAPVPTSIVLTKPLN